MASEALDQHFGEYPYLARTMLTRRSHDENAEIDWAGQEHWYSVRDAFGVGAACKGDSGGPAINTGFGFDLNVGVASNAEMYAGHSCPSVEGSHKFRYAQPGASGAWFDSTAGGGLCTDYVTGNWHYWRCW
jgi:hypothetical protein